MAVVKAQGRTDPFENVETFPRRAGAAVSLGFQPGGSAGPGAEDALPVACISRNRLLRALPPEDFALLQPHLSPVTFEQGRSVGDLDQPIEHCYFVESGVISMLARSARARSAEVGLVGPEGMIGVAVVMGDDRSPHETCVQIAGSGVRLPAERLRRAMAASPGLQRRLLRYGHALLIQMTHAALANGTARITERVSRWILMSHDRVGHNELHLTHDLLSSVLAVRRPGVTDALHELEGRGLIRSTRGQITVLDRLGLIAVADGCYGAPEDEYERLMAS